ncbi:Pol protein [Phytophthora palmivora]|uniref:Pol protein n=1 Tax=Phytophthora palmivora TaxID=4796 RepID=A0A2P4XFF7_9STRA|nr:Pol protein [Phytophthora palmivora]
MSLDFVFGLPADDKGNTGILVFVCSDSVFCYHGLPETIVSDRDPRFTGAFWDTLFQLLGAKLTMSTADHPQTDGQTERVNRVLEDTLRRICAEAPRSWSDQLPMVGFALNNAVHTSTGFTPFYLNGLRHRQVPLTLRERHRCLHRKWRRDSKRFFLPGLRYRASVFEGQLSSFIDNRLTLISRAQDKQKEYSDKPSRGNLNVFKEGSLVFLDTKNLPLKMVSFIESNKLKHRFIGSFAVLARHGTTFTIDLPKSMSTHSTFCVRRLKRHHDPLGPSPRTEEGQGEISPLRTEAEPQDNRSSRCRSL